MLITVMQVLPADDTSRVPTLPLLPLAQQAAPAKADESDMNGIDMSLDDRYACR